MSANQLRARRIGANSPLSPGDSDSQDSGDSLHLHLLTIGLALLAGIIFTLVEHNEAGHQHSTWCTTEIVIQALVVVIGSWFARRYLDGSNALIIPPLMIMTILLSLLCEPIQRMFFGTGHPFEELVMHCQSNLMLAMATCGFRRGYRQLCAIMSVFLTIFCLTKTTGALVIGLFCVYSVLGVIWLIASHWDQVSRRALAGSGRRFPVGWLIAVPAILLTAIIYFGGGGAAAADRMKGFMPSSGGTEDHHDHAHGGVKDGDGLVAGEDNIQSFGPIEDAPFADDDKPSLYDAFDDTFDEPLSKIKKTERAIALPPDSVAEVQDRMARSKQAGREFSTLRRKNDKKTGAIKDLNSSALFYVAGRTPLHLRLQVFDVYDGVDWIPADNEPVRERLRLTHSGDRHWLSVANSKNIDNLFVHRETHAVKIINLQGNVIPSPAHTAAISINQVDRIDFFKAYNNGLVALDRDNLPELTPIQIVSNRLDYSLLDSAFNVVWVPFRNKIETALPKHSEMSRVESLAQQWTEGKKRGVESINAIVEGLRTRCRLDRSKHVDSEDSEFPVSDFLFDTKAGPEYLFATSAALMLRSQGYPTRYVAGFYARPDKYEAKKRHTPVHTSDAHVWCEVNIGSDKWITVEPSPGYEILAAPPGLLARLGSAVGVVVDWVRKHPFVSCAALLALVVTLWNRRRIVDFVRTTIWNITQPSNNRRFALRSLRLLEGRFGLAGMQRPAGSTFGNWVTSRTELSTNAELRQFATIANRAAFGSGEINADERRLCEALVRDLTFSQIRKGQVQTRKKERP